LRSGDRTMTLADLMFEISTMFGFTGDESGQRKLLEAVLSLDPDRAMAMNNLGYSLLTSERSGQQSWRLIERAYEAFPDDPSVIDSLAWLRYRQGRIADDLAGAGAYTLIIDAIARMDEPNEEVLDHFGDIAYAAGAGLEARSAWTEARRLLSVEDHRSTLESNYRTLQLRTWGVLVVDPATVYDRLFGDLMDRLDRKLRALEAGEKPELAPMFDSVAEAIDTTP
ncbi:MAG: hypothetical protein AAF432_11960, partial [Planctomycetota bacterium]